MKDYKQDIDWQAELNATRLRFPDRCAIGFLFGCLTASVVWLGIMGLNL